MAQAKLDKLLRSPRPEEIPPAEAKVKEAEELYQDADVQMKLIESVRDKARIRTRTCSAGASRESGCGSCGPSQGDLALLKAGAWKPDIEIARAEVAEAQSQIERVEANVDRTRITAPIAGEILQCKVRLGEYAQTGHWRSR